MTYICVSKLYISGSDNCLSPGRRQAITWGNDGILLIEPLGTKFSKTLIEIYTFSFKEMYLKMTSGKWHLFLPGLNVLTYWSLNKMASILQMTCIFLNENVCTLITISLKFVPRDTTDNNLALVRVMAWLGIDDKALAEPIMTGFKYAQMCYQAHWGTNGITYLKQNLWS